MFRYLKKLIHISKREQINTYRNQTDLMSLWTEIGINRYEYKVKKRTKSPGLDFRGPDPCTHYGGNRGFSYQRSQYNLTKKNKKLKLKQLRKPKPVES